MPKGVAEITQGLAVGLGATDRMPANSESFVELSGCLAAPEGLIAYQSKVNEDLLSLMEDAGISVEHPFPQVFRCQKKTIVLTETALYVVTEGTPWTWAKATVLDFHDQSYTYRIAPGGGAWAVVDVGDPIIAFNETNMLLIGQSSVFGEDKFLAGAMCSFRGRIMMGDFSDWNEEWAAIAQMINADSPVSFPTTVTPNLIWWSKFGADDFYWMLQPIQAVYGPIGSTLAQSLVKNGTFKYHEGASE